MEDSEPIFEEDVDELVSQNIDKIFENIKTFHPETSQQLILLSKYLKNSPRRDAYIKMFAEMENLINMNMYTLYLAIKYYETFGVSKPDPTRIETALEYFLQDGDKYTDILVNSNIKDLVKKNTPEFQFNTKISLASYLRLLGNFLAGNSNDGF